MTPPFITSELLAAAGVRHAFFTREGGVSQGLYASLNVGVGSSDDPAAVAENRARCAQALGVTPERLAGLYQIHSPDCLTLDHAQQAAERPKADAWATALPGVALAVLTADCAPVLLADPQAGVVAAAHAGWKGALAGVTDATLERMEALGARRDRIVAAIGPCIGPDSYEVDESFEARFLDESREAARFFRPGEAADRRWFDLPAYVLWRLSRAGVTQAEWTGQDTCADEARFFSNRRAFKRGDPDFGRMMSAIRL
ncbi:peptidoglycan editing factor PgeF [Brevundimonas sp. 2R-24]|uniref:Purine nucleoside phosphorylase n=1 Tax=Peiella sedimenti TaxID=3061083 RepID=A0ABT8SMQ2_9CAUL|nr:peptidoglycan editing factor PgeF [Caulobacteraceae bacterium XZ-24]